MTAAEREVAVPPHGLGGALAVPADAVGIVVFAHGSGSSRLSPRNLQVSRALNGRGLATLLFDLLTDGEAEDRSNVFDIPLLAARLIEAIAFVQSHRATEALPVGLFGASTGAAAALVAAAEAPGEIAAVVSRGGRPDLAGIALAQVTAPTLLIVGAADHGVIELNQAALAMLRCEKRLELVAGATHLFPEPGAMERVIDLAGAWFEAHLTPRA
jgi:pimeloyl-ACP methyl ester carboxylesterase